METNPSSSTTSGSLKRNASSMDDVAASGSAKRVRSDEPPPGHPLSASPMAHLPLPVTRTVEFALKRSPSSSVPTGSPGSAFAAARAASENDHPPATGPTDGDPDAAFRAAVLAKLAEASSGSSASPSTASTRTGPLPPIPAAIPDIEGKEDAGEEEDGEEEETDDPDAERSDGGWDDEDEWVPPPVAASIRNSAGVGEDIAAEANATGQSLISPPPTPVPARTDASPMPPPVGSAPGSTPVAEPTPDVVAVATAAAADVPAAALDVPAASALTTASATTAAVATATHSAAVAAHDDLAAAPEHEHENEHAAAAVEHAPAPADVDDDWLEAVAPSNFPLNDDEDDDAFWPVDPPSPLTQPTHPSPPPFSALPDSQHDTALAGSGSGAARSGSGSGAARLGSHGARVGSPDSYADSGDEPDQQGVEVAPGFALRGSDGAKVQCALCGRWMGPEKTAEHVARVCGTIPSPERARKAAKRRSASMATTKTRRTSSTATTPKQPRTPRKEKPVALPAARLAARRAELDADAWAARVDDERGVLCKACGVWVDVGGAGLGAVQRWSGRTGHKSVCKEVVEATRREEAEARMRELTHAHEAPAPVPPEILADKRVRRIDGDQAQCNVCGVWTLFKNWEAHQGGKCEQIRARREAKAARRASKTAKGLDALSDLSSESEDDRRHPVYFVGGPGKKAKAAAEAASGSGSASGAATGAVAQAAAAASTAAAAPMTAAGAKTASAAIVAPVAAAASVSSSAAVASVSGASVAAPANATSPAAKSSATASVSSPKAAAASASATAPKNGTASASASAPKNGTASSSASTPATKAGKAAAGPASIYLTPGAPAPTKPPPGWPAGASWRPWMSDPRYGMGVIPVETMQRMYAPGGRYGPPVDKGKGKAAAPAAAASTSAKPAGSAAASTSAGAKSAGPAASSTSAKPAGPAATSTGAKPSGPAASASAGAKPAPVTGKRAAGPSDDAPAAKKAKVAAASEAGPPKKKMLPLESIVAEADARAAAAAAASAAGSSTASATKSAATTPSKATKPTGPTPASVSKSAATTSAVAPPSTSTMANTAKLATPSASKPRAMQMARKSYRPPPPYGPGKNKRATSFSQAAKRRAASPSSSSESEKEPKPWSNAPQPYLMPANPPRVMQIRRPYQLCGLEAFVSSDPNRSTRFEDLPTDPETLLRYERQVILHFDADVAQIAQDNRIQCKGCSAWIKLPTSGVSTKKWYGRIGHKASCPGNIERQKAAAALPAAQIPEVVFDEPFRIQKIKGSKVQCAGCSKNVSAPMWARHVEERCAVYTAASGAPKPESSDSESEAEPGPSNGKPRGRLDITIAKRRAQLLEDTAVREIGEDRLMCDLCGKWVKISKHLHAGYKWYGEQGHRARCIASHPDWKPRADKDDPPSSPATSVPATPAKPGSSTSAAAGKPAGSALRSPNRGTQAPPSSPPSVIVIPDTSSDHEGHDDDAEYNPDNDGSGAESESSEDPELDV